MKLDKEEQQRYIKAKKKVRRIQIFYLHLALYAIGTALIMYNFYIMEGEYVGIITGLNITTLVFWTICLFIHAWSVFKGRLIFKKSWEDKKIEKFIKEKNEVEAKFWE